MRTDKRKSYQAKKATKRMKPTHMIKEGTHIMLLNKAREVSECVNSVL
ncbi:MAG TPA: hypothetical protein VGI82_06400 [Chitinophagaceae bacterium]